MFKGIFMHFRECRHVIGNSFSLVAQLCSLNKITLMNKPDLHHILSRINLNIIGEGSVIVLFAHGFGSDQQNWT